MKNSLLLIFASCILSLYSCGDSGTSNDDATTESTEPSATPQNVVPESTTSTDITSGDATSSPASMGTTSAPSPVPASSSAVPGATSAPATTSASGPLNPAHGEPGHRCEIPVGAPLNSAPSSTPPAGTTALPTKEQGSTTQPIQIQSAPQGQPTPVSGNAPTSIMTAPAGTPAAAPATTTTAPGMNPPHGQPGHDCSIAVGAPLKK